MNLYKYTDLTNWHLDNIRHFCHFNHFIESIYSICHLVHSSNHKLMHSLMFMPFLFFSYCFILDFVVKDTYGSQTTETQWISFVNNNNNKNNHNWQRGGLTTIAILYLHSDVEISITMIENGSFYMLIFTFSEVDSSENAIKGIFTSSFSHRFWHFILAVFMPFWLRKIV